MMLSKLLNSKQLMIVLLMILVIGGALNQTLLRTQASTMSNIMTFVPQSQSKDDALAPQTLNEVNMSGLRYIQAVGSTTDWNVIKGLASQGELDALLIPRDAQEDVQWEELKQWFFDGLIVAGIDIPGDTLAGLLGNPGLYAPQRSGDYDYHIYAMRISGHPEDIQKLKEAGFPDGPVAGIKHPLSGGYSSGGGYLSGTEDDAITFLRRLDDFIHAQNLPKLSTD